MPFHGPLFEQTANQDTGVTVHLGPGNDVMFDIVAQLEPWRLSHRAQFWMCGMP